MKIKWKIVLALSIFLIFIIIFNNYYYYRIIRNLVNEEISEELTNYSSLGVSLLDSEYPGEWRLEGDILYKGDYPLNDSYTLLDRITEDTGIITTLFAKDTRISTTVKDDQGNRKVGTKASDKVIETVLETGDAYQGTADVAGKMADSLYIPLRDSDNNVVGMWFVGIYNETIQGKISKALLSGTGIIIAVTIFGLGLAYLIGRKISDGFVQIRGYLERMEKGEFHIEFHAATKSRRDELGEITRSFIHMQEQIRSIISSIKTESAKIETSSAILAEGADSVYNNIEDISATTEELSAGMEETAASTEEMSATASEIEADSRNVADKSRLGSQLVKEIKARAISLQSSALSSKQNAIDMYGDANRRLRQSIQKADAINEIKHLSKAIQNINTQTNLLALNASIESARAGDAGRGFAVVASQIGELAKNAKDSVAKIEDITNEVALAVSDMVQDSNHLLSFMDHQVIPDYKVLEQISTQYYTDADSVEGMVTEITNSVEHLQEAIHYIRQAVDEVSTASDEGSKGAADIAEKSTDIFHKTNEVLEQAQLNKEIAANLNEKVQFFQI